jgi:hypothetical protein
MREAIADAFVRSGATRHNLVSFVNLVSANEGARARDPRVSPQQR